MMNDFFNLCELSSRLPCLVWIAGRAETRGSWVLPGIIHSYTWAYSLELHGLPTIGRATARQKGDNKNTRYNLF